MFVGSFSIVKQEEVIVGEDKATVGLKFCLYEMVAIVSCFSTFEGSSSRIYADSFSAAEQEEVMVIEGKERMG